MRPTTSTMLQQNNNNNHPCLNMSDSTQEMLQKCSRSSLPFPSRLELGELPLIRGLRAWALCSKNRRKAGSLLGRGKAPATPPLGRGSSSACLRPADVYLSGELGRMGYRLPQGLDARQAGIGALVTVATLKTSEGSGKTQTQCLFLRTERGSCSYATPKPGSGGTTSMVGDLLRGKRKGGTDPLPEQADANRVRVRSGRRWRKSSNVAAREKPAASRERQQRSWEDPAAERDVENQDKDGKRFSSPQQDNSRARCCHSVSPKTFTQSGRRAQRRESRDVKEGGESPGRGFIDGLNSEEKKPEGDEEQEEEEEEGKGGLYQSDLSEPNPDLESDSTHRDSPSSREADEETNETFKALKTRTSHRRTDFTEREDSNPDEDCSDFTMTRGDRKPEDEPCEAGGGSDHDESEKETQSRSVSPEVSLRTKESSVPVEGRVCNVDHQGSEEEEPASSNFQSQEENFTSNKSKTGNEEFRENREPEMFLKKEGNRQLEDKGVLSSPLRLSSTSETESRKQEDEFTCNKLDDASEEDHSEELQRRSDSKGDRSSQSRESGSKRDGDVSRRTITTHSESKGKSSPPTAVGLCNPAPPLPPLASMATDLPCLETEEEEREVETGKGGDGQKEKRNPEGELEKQSEEERSSSVAAEEGRKEEEEEEEEDEFGVFMQAEGEPAWSEGVNMSASVPCGSRGSVALRNHAITGESTHCAPEWTGSLFHQSDDSWTAFPQDTTDSGQDAEQWWPASAAETGKDRVSTEYSLDAVFAEAFPSQPSSSSGDPWDLSACPTLTQLLRGRVTQDQGLLDNFHDLNKMISQSYKTANGVSRDLLMKTLYLQQPMMESHPASWTTSRRLSPGLPPTNQHAHHAAAKRRLSYDHNRNIME